MKNVKKRVISVLIVIIFLFGMIPSVISANSIYNDVPPTHWAYEVINTWSGDSYGVLQGDGRGNFFPDNGIRLADLSAILSRIFGYSERTQGVTITPNWATAYVQQAISAGIITRASTIDASIYVNREQAVRYLALAYGIEPIGTQTTFADNDLISARYRPYINAFQRLGYVRGRGNNLFAPKEVFTRAEIMQIIDNITSDILDSSVNRQTYSNTLIVRNSDLAINNSTARGNVIIGQGASNGEIAFNNTSIQGNMVVNASNISIVIDGDSRIANIIINGSNVTIDNQGNVEDINVIDNSNNVVGGGTSGNDTRQPTNPPVPPNIPPRPPTELPQTGGNEEEIWESAYVPETGGMTGRIVVSEDWYFTTPTFENVVQDGRGRTFHNNKLYICAEPNVPRSKFDELARTHNAQITEFRRSNLNQFGDSYTFIFDREFTIEELEELSEMLLKLDIVSNVRIARPVEIDLTMQTPNDSRWDTWDESNPSGNNWGWEAINALSAWQYEEYMQNVNVLVLDTGFYRNHEDLDFMYNFVRFAPAGDIWEPTHGTHVAGIIGAIHNNERGISGVAPNSFMYGVAVGAITENNRVQTMTETQLMDTIEWHVVQHGVRVINLSVAFGGNLLEFAYSRRNENARIEMNELTQYLERRFLRIIEQEPRFVFVTSAGNQGIQNYNETHITFVEDRNARLGYRSCPDGTLAGINGVVCTFARIQHPRVRNRIIVVGAIQNDGNNQFRMANFSQRGEFLNVTAPGVDIYSTYSVRRMWYRLGGEELLFHTYRKELGTSMAAPFVSGLATMIFGINPDFTGDEVRDIIVSTADRRNFNMINAVEAVREAINRKGSSTIQGTVSERLADGSFVPVVGANVRLYTADGQFIEQTQTRADNGGNAYYIFSVPQGDYIVTVSKSGFETDRQTVQTQGGVVRLTSHELTRIGNNDTGNNNNNNVPPTGFTTSIISAGNNHTVALRNDGTVWVWGCNRYGQLGNRTITDRHTPMQIQNLSNIIAISARDNHTVALRNDGTVWAWGSNSGGQLGDGTTTDRHIPVQVQNLSNITAISAGSGYSVALRNDGTVWAWGTNRNGRIGDGTTTDRHTPVQVQNLSNITAISAGGSHSIALRNDGTVWTWGTNGYGQLGDGTTTNRYTPVQVQGLSNITAISAGNAHSIALRNDGTVWAWGWNGVGQLGDGTAFIDRRVPVQVQNLTNITAISAGSAYSVALRNDGTVWAWGGNSRGRLGNGTTASSRTPLQVVGENGIGYLNLFLNSNGNTTNNNNNNVPPTGFTTPMISAGNTHTVALRNDGTVWAWGSNDNGQLEDGTTTSSHIPVQVQNLSNITAISTTGGILRGHYTVALRNDGTVWAWGNNIYGQLGDGTTINRRTPVQVQNLNNITAISARSSHTVALRSDGTVWAWGRNRFGQLGDGTTTTRHTPVQVQNLSNITAISAGGSHTVALRSDGTVWAWGNNGGGQLGDGTVTHRLTPVQVQNLSNIIAISAGDNHTVALRNDGTVWAWGSNQHGRLGDGTTINRNTPVQVQNLSNITAISAGHSHTVALKNDGIVWAWGHNNLGQLGDGTTANHRTPVQVVSEKGIGHFNVGAN